MFLKYQFLVNVGRRYQQVFIKKSVEIVVALVILADLRCCIAK